MSKKMLGVLALVMFAAVAVYANDVWKDKDYQSWDQKDVDKILKDSPWTRTVQFGGGGSGAIDAPFTATGDAAHNDNASGSSGGGGGSGRSRNSAIAGTGAMQGAGQEMNFTISWYSSRTIREALERRRELSGGAPNEDTKKNMTAELGTYQVLIRANNLGLFGKDADALKASSYLMLKSTKDKILPSNVTIEKGQNDKPIAVLYEFPKKTAAGEPAIGPNEKAVEFFTQAGKTPVKVSFDITKMSDKQGADY
jgi:hypothetical protein